MEVKTRELPPSEDHPDPATAQDMWGDREIVALAIGPGGGSRYWYRMVEEHNTMRLSINEHSKQRIDVLVLARIGWRVVWTVGHDMTTISVHVADSRGVHTHELDTERSSWGYESRPWVGQEPLTETELIELFAKITIPER